uniref:RNA-directed DNA polymerase from mobile element jockey-like n=1 Tax=Saccoglossus kowalevskii TaxID=10224 RepID=A0ABM0MA50_SACKO
MKKSKPEKFWSVLNNSISTNDKNNIIDMDRFKQHFENLGQSTNKENVHNFDPRLITHSNNEESNTSITVEGVMTQIKKLNNNKAAGVDLIINEFLKNSRDDITSLIVQLFNIVLDTGIVPTSWIMGCIKPIFKNTGDTSDPSNYRGITLLSCLGKFFTAVINDRLTSYLNCVGSLGEEQAGFRAGYSTLDHIFVLHSVIDLYLHNKKRVYCAFIDYKKAFDLIDSTSLWFKLISNHINGKIITVIYNMYNQAKSCVIDGSDTSDFFNCNVGVRQGENLSPLLFAIYLNDFEYFISKHYNGLKYMASEIKTYLSNEDIEVFLKLFTLLYADDTIVLSESETELQSALNAVYTYCNECHLTVNANKTKVVIFSRGRVKKYPAFKFGNETIEVTFDYIYLGITFNYNNKFRKAICKQTNQARCAMFSLLMEAKQLCPPIDIQLQLLYGCEIWGHADLSQIESFYLKFCKRLLKVHKNTANCMVYGELG